MEKVKQRREGLPTQILEDRRFFEMYGAGKTDTPKGWNTPENWKELDEIPINKYFGFALCNASNYLLIDFDHIINDKGEWLEPAKDAYKRITSICNTYYEYSTSGTGLHLICDLGDMSGCFEPITNDKDHIIVFTPISDYLKLSPEDQKKAPKIELFYHTQGRYVLLTGNNKKVVEVARNEDAAAIFRECLNMVADCHKDINPKAAPMPEKIPIGSRTQFLISQIGALSNTKMDPETIKHTIISLNQTKLSEPLTDTELAKEVFPALTRGWQDTVKELPKFCPIDATDLLKMDIAPLRFVVKDLCPEGFGILAAPPKTYKSFLALQICVAICKGLQVFGRDTVKTKCLYFDLESTDRRPQERLKAMGVGNIQGLQFMTQTEMPKVGHRMINLSTGFDILLDDYLAEHNDIGFVVIDVFKKIRSEQKRTQSLYEHDYEDIEKLQAIASKRNVCLLLIHHTTKIKDGADPFNNMGGSTGILGAADFAWIIDKEKRNADEATLYTTGRDIEPMQLSIRFDTKKLNWQFMGTAEDVQANKDLQAFINSHITQTIKKLVEINGGKWEGTSTSIISASNDLHTPIYETKQQVGRFLQKNYEYFLIESNIEMQYQAGQKERRYTFIRK